MLALASGDDLQLLLALLGVHGSADCVAYALPDDLLGDDLEGLDLQGWMLALEARSCRCGHPIRRRRRLRWKWVALSLLLDMQIVPVGLA